MVEPARSRGRAAAWRPWATAGRRPAPQWLDGLAEFLRRAAQRLREWALAEVAPGRLVPWLAIAFGSGILVYFTADREPALWAAISLVVATVVFAILARHRPVAFPVMLGIAAAACGFATATAKRTMISHPVLSAPVWNADVAGFIEVREERERSDRIVVRVERIAAPRLKEAVERVRVSVRKGTAPAVGSFVEFKARLSPPLAPLRPGGYDFARDMYFQGIGASGFVLGSIRTTPPEKAPSLWLRYAAVIAGLREAIDQRIRAVVPGDQGAIASALITGKRDALTAPVFDAMYASGIGHVLSISGYHMAVVAGIIFFALRASFALMPAFTGRHSIKKWAALRGAVRGRVLSSDLGRRGRYPALVHHDRDRARRRDGGSPDADVPHHHGGGARRAAAGARSDRASELPDVVCRDARARRRLPAGAAVDERGRRYSAWCPHRAVGRARDRRRW